MEPPRDPASYPAGIPGYLAGMRGRLCASPQEGWVPPATAARVAADARRFIGGTGVGGLLDDPRVDQDAAAAIRDWLLSGPTPGPCSVPGDVPPLCGHAPGGPPLVL